MRPIEIVHSCKYQELWPNKAISNLADADHCLSRHFYLRLEGYYLSKISILLV
jgi:hypothetical protein